MAASGEADVEVIDQVKVPVSAWSDMTPLDPEFGSVAFYNIAGPTHTRQHISALSDPEFGSVAFYKIAGPTHTRQHISALST